MWRLRQAYQTFWLCILATGVWTIDSPCKVVHGNYEFDLRDLAAQDYWEVTETLHTGTNQKRVFYLSLCHPLRNAPELCAGNNTGVCAVKYLDGNETEVIVSNGGQIPVTGPKVPEDDWIEYVYDSGEECRARGSIDTYKTYLSILCQHDETQEIPGPILLSSPGCQLYFGWMSKAACPKKLDAEKPSTCTINFSNSSHLLNLHSLHSPTYYTVNSSDTTYEMNICGPVTSGRCGKDNATICIVNDDSSPEVLGTTDDMTLDWKDDVLILTYRYQNITTEIQLYCERTATKTHIYFVSKNDTTVIFSLKTSAICTPELPQCVLEDDHGNVYDLRPLHKLKGNWESLDTRDDHKDLLYHINLCGQVNEGTYYHCPLGPIGACQTSVGRESAYNLGYLTSHPVINRDGSITVLYTGGDACQNGQHARSTRINLICNPIEHEPILVEETKSCEYVFTWLTPFACPRHVTEGSNCQVVDPLYKYVYDLNPLRNAKEDYNVSDGVHDYLINVCGPQVSSCNGEENTSGVCQVKGSDQYSCGLATTSVTFHDGTLMMNFHNGTGDCKGNNTRSSKILFMCDQEESGRDGPHFLHEDEFCTYHFFWRTRHACPPFHVVDCTVSSSDGMVYDLSELSSPNMNEEYFSPDKSKKFVLNVCRSVVHSKSSRCPYNAGACLIDLKHENESINIGEVHSGPYLENGSLRLRYTRGTPCKDNSNSSETVIEFKCDKDGLYPYPQLIGEEECKYIFEWKTPFACPKFPGSTIIPTDAPGNCTIGSPYSDYVFDLNSLKKETGYEVQSDSGFHLVVNVCAEVSKEICSEEGIGACSYTHDKTNVVNAGHANADLHYLPGFLSLYYTGGDNCSNTIKRSTLISFICGAEDTKEGPVLIHEDLDQCRYYINWYTELACERRIKCFVDTWNRRIDLSPLIRATGNYETSNPENSKEKFYLNVCRPLNPIIGLNCQPGSAGCLSSPKSETGIVTLGHPLVTPIYIYDNGVQIMYTHGSKCPFNSGLNVSTLIHFTCDKSAGKGNPIYKMVTHDCQYQFEWPTAHVCEDFERGRESVCQIMFPAAKTNINLKPLQRSEGYIVNFKGKEYKVNVCGPACNESGVCTSDGDSYGQSNKSELKWDYDQLKLTYYGGDPCVGALSGYKTTSIYFECDMKAGFGHPVADNVMESLQCMTVFRWHTNLTCIEGIYNYDNQDNVPDVTKKPSVTDDSTENHSDNIPSKEKQEAKAYSSVPAIVGSVLIISGIIFVAVLILFKSERRRHVVASARRLFGIRGYRYNGQTRVEGSTLLGFTSSKGVFKVDDSDDDLLN